MGKFQKSVADLRNQVALQGAETVARLKKIETDLREGLHEARQELDASFTALVQSVDTAFRTLDEKFETGFSLLTATLEQQSLQHQEGLTSVLDLMVAQAGEEQAWREQQETWRHLVEERLSRLETKPPAA